MEKAADNYVAGLLKWFNGMDFLGLLTIIVVAYVLFKITGPVMGWITRHFMNIKRVLPNETKLAHIDRVKRSKTLADLFSFIVKTLIIVTAIYTILTDIGISLEPVLASAGIASVALGFGAQSIVKDVLAGFFIVFENQYRVGDVIQLSGIGFPATPVEGTVQSVTLRRTTLRDRDGNVHVVPNGQIVEVINRTLGYSRFRFTFAVNVETDVDSLIALINNVGQGMLHDSTWKKEIVDAPHYEELGQIGKAGVNVTVSGTTMPGFQWKVKSEFRKRLVLELQKSDIEIADVES